MPTNEPLRLLFIEDASDQVELALREFARHKIPTAWQRVETAEQLATELATFKPDVVLSDFSMPQYDGWSALARVRATDPNLPFLFVSGTIGEEKAMEALRHGAMDYVLKDNLKRLVPAVIRARGEAELRRDKQKAVQQLRDIVDTSLDWIWELDAALRIVFSSPSVEATLGRSVTEILDSSFLHHVAFTELDSVDAQMRSLDAGRRTTRFMMLAATLDGEHRWLETNVHALLDAENRVVGFRGSSRDVSRREEQQQRILYLTRVLRMASGVNGAMVRLRDRDQLLHETCRIAVNVGGYVAAHVSLLEPGQVLRIGVACGASAAPGTVLPLADSGEDARCVTAFAVLSRAPVVVHEMTAREQVEFVQGDVQSPIRAVVSLPLLVDQTVVGALTLGVGAAGLLDEREVQMLVELAANLSFALQYLDREKAVHFLSYFDPLTGLAQRSLFCERLEQRLARGVGPESRDAVMVLDLERLGLINDSAGRHVGDGLLQRVADRMRSVLADPQCLAYLGAGMYAVVLPLLGCAEQELSLLQERISGLFLKAFEIDGHTIRASARYGIARYPEDGASPRLLLENAEAALKGAKAAGEDFVPYRMQTHRGQDQRLALEQRLRVAIEERQFLLHYQPKIDVGSGRIVGLEGLLRWNDPARGLIAPGEFLPILEATHLIVEVGDRVVKQAVEELRYWAALGLNVRVAVNVSTWQLRRRDFVERILSHVGKDLIGASCGLDIEITETALLHDSEDAMGKLSLLRAAGIGIAIDDFGTGYSSLSRLSLLPVDTLKIDRSFVAGLPSAPAAVALVSTVIALARAFSLTTVAEGVETQEQLQSLRELGCDQSQGYFHGRPQAARDVTELMLGEQPELRNAERSTVRERTGRDR